MAASITRLRTRRDRLRAEQAAELRALILARPDLPERAASQIIAAIDRETASQQPWGFILVDPSSNAAVVRWLGKNSSRPRIAVQLWAVMLTALRRDTGEITQSRDELAEAIETEPRNVSRVMTELEGIGAISRRRERVAGMRGQGVVRYYLSPRIATHQTGAARDAAQAEAPLLRLLDGGATPA